MLLMCVCVRSTATPIGRHKAEAEAQGQKLLMTGHSLGGKAKACVDCGGPWRRIRGELPLSTAASRIEPCSGALVGAVAAVHDVDGIGFSPPGLYYQATRAVYFE